MQLYKKYIQHSQISEHTLSICSKTFMRTKPSIRLLSFFKCRGQWSILFWRQRTKAVRLIKIILFAIYLRHFIAWCYSGKNPLYSKILVTRFIAPSYTPLPCGIIPQSLIAIRHWFWETLKLKTIHKCSLPL